MIIVYCVSFLHYCVLCIVCGLLFVERSLRVGVVCVVCDACCMRFVVSFELVTCAVCLFIVFCVFL